MIPIRRMVLYLPFTIFLFASYIGAELNGAGQNDVYGGSGPLADPAQGQPKDSMAFKIIKGSVPMNAVTFHCVGIFEPSFCKVSSVISDELAVNELAFLRKRPTVYHKEDPITRDKTPIPSSEPTDRRKFITDVRSVWITEETIVAIKKLGFNSMKLSFGYWVVDTKSGFSSPQEFVDNVMKWASLYDLGVFLAFAAAPGCQNLHPITNCESTVPEWQNEFNRKQSIEVIKKVTGVYKKYTSFMAIGLLHEPSTEGINNEILALYYTEAIRALQDLKFGGLVMINPLVEKRFDSADIKFWCGFVAKQPFVWVAISSYLYWDALDTEEQLTKEIFRRASFFRDNKACHIFVDEWSVALKPNLSKDKLQALAANQLSAYSEASKGMIYGPFRTTTDKKDTALFSYESAVAQGILRKNAKMVVRA
uniref:glucan 1,3-beta-glucosidase n=1 Tax=Albugo laibachii Nc14 TaxID=890382 RepID=F0WHG2_9STRA|nr:putative exo1 [Albugo laibachii Nc14]|eukprot:CCA20681.1 putative exo1 [Albugo laibachii Nc14]